MRLIRAQQMNKTESLPFRAFVPLLLANLEDADPGVRETAKTAVVELFRCVDQILIEERDADMCTETRLSTQRPM